MSALTAEFPGFKIIYVEGKGWRVSCRTCYLVRNGGTGWSHPFALVDAIPEMRAWVGSHVHALGEREARAECERLAVERLARRLHS